MHSQFKPAKESLVCQLIKEELGAAGFDVQPDVIREDTMFRLNGVCENHTVKEITIPEENPTAAVLEKAKGFKHVALYKISGIDQTSGTYVLRLVYF